MATINRANPSLSTSKKATPYESAIYVRCKHSVLAKAARPESDCVVLIMTMADW